jgi:hypothetical protein
MSSRLLVVELALLAAATGCCSPRIRSFEVTPATVCTGDPPSVGHWDARGDLALQVSVDDRDASPPEVQERLSGLPPGSRIVTLRLVASHKGVEGAAQTRWVEQLPDTFQTEVAFPAKPEEGGVVASGTKNPARWGDRFLVATVATPDGRTLEVRHADRTAQVGAEPSEAFAGTALEGPWELRWKSDGGSPPELLRLSTLARCKRGS